MTHNDSKFVPRIAKFVPRFTRTFSSTKGLNSLFQSFFFTRVYSLLRIYIPYMVSYRKCCDFIHNISQCGSTVYGIIPHCGTANKRRILLSEFFPGATLWLSEFLIVPHCSRFNGCQKICTTMWHACIKVSKYFVPQKWWPQTNFNFSRYKCISLKGLWLKK